VPGRAVGEFRPLLDGEQPRSAYDFRPQTCVRSGG